MSTGGYWAAVGDPRYSAFEQAADPTEGDPTDRRMGRYGPGVVDQSQALWPGGQTCSYDAAEITGYAYSPNAPYDPPDFPGAAQDFRSLEYYGQVGEVETEVPAMVLPYQQGPGFQMQGFASPLGWRARLSAFLNRSPIGPLQQRVNPGTSSMAVPDADMLAGFPLGKGRPWAPHTGYVTRWPTAQMVYRPMGSSSDG